MKEERKKIIEKMTDRVVDRVSDVFGAEMEDAFSEAIHVVVQDMKG